MSNIVWPTITAVMLLVTMHELARYVAWKMATKIYEEVFGKHNDKKLN